MKKLTSIALIASVLAALASCGDAAQPAQDGTTAPDTAPVETAPLFEADDLPADLDFGGKELTWYVGDYASAYWDDFYAEEANGSRINDAVYNARRRVEERLNVKLNYIRKQVVWGNRTDIHKDITASVMAGDGAYDIYSGYDLVGMMLEDKYFHDLNTSKYINLTKPWWNQSLLGMLPGNTVYTALGDGTLSLIKHTFCLFFNQDKLDAMGIKENMYDLVESGKWTLDKLAELTANGYADVNGNTEVDFGDEFGLTMGDANKYIGWQFALGGELVHLEKDGYKLVNGSEKMVDIFDRLYTFLRKNVNVNIPTNVNTDSPWGVDAGGGNLADKTFMSGGAMFTASLVADAATILADAKFDYGILPYPKADEAQENYVSAVQRFASFSIPVYADVDISGAVIEAWSSEAYRQIQPEYFEVTLKARYSDDDQMAGIFDLLRETIRFDIGDFFCEILNEIASEFKGMMTKDAEGQWLSNYAEKEPAWNEALDAAWEALS